jgi:hypothetical protein
MSVVGLANLLFWMHHYPLLEMMKRSIEKSGGAPIWIQSMLLIYSPV